MGKIELRPAQKTALKLLRDHDNFALLMAMRTGKSAPILMDFGQKEQNGKCQDLLIIAPAGVYRTWLSNIEMCCSDNLQSRLNVLVWSPTSTNASSIAEFLKTDQPRCLLVNIESLSRRTSKARSLCEKFLKQRPAIVTLDESTIIKNPKALRTKYILKSIVPLARYRRILSGLVTPRSPLDLYCQFAFLDRSILQHKDFYSFRNAHAIMKRDYWGGRWVDHIVGFLPGTDEKLRQLIAAHSYRVEFRPKEPSTYSIREITLTDEQQRYYKELRDFATTKLADASHVTATVVIAQMMKMHQVLCGWVRDEQGIVKFIPENRTAGLLEELDDYNGKAIIWFSYVENLKRARSAIQQEYGEDSTASFYGDNLAERENEEKRFKDQENCRFMLATPASGGWGRTWSNADRVIYFSNTDNLEHREQSEQRAMGVEKVHGVDFVDLVSPDTIDTKILQALRKKINMATAINGDNYREWLI